MAPAAFVVISARTPRRCISQMGNATSWRRIPLVSVQAALHGEHRLPAKLAAHKATLVTRRRTALHMGNLAERDDDGILDLLSQRAEARAEHDADRGLAITEALPQDASRFFEVRFEHVISRHVRSSP